MSETILSAIRAVGRVTGETAAGAALGVTVFCVVLGSSSVEAVVGVGGELRWVALVVLVVIAVGLAWRTRETGVDRSMRLAFALGGWVAVLAVLSAAWSVDPRLTVGRGGSFALLVVAAGALAFAARARPVLLERLLLGSLAATVVAALVGVLLLPIVYGDAVQAANPLTPARFRGVGENPDTLAMLEGVAAPIALWFVVTARTSRRRGAAIVALIVLLASVSASGSRGGLLAAFVGGIVLSVLFPVPLRRRLALSAAVCVAVVGATAGTRVSQLSLHAPTSSTPSGSAQSSSSSSASSASSVPAASQSVPQVGQAVGPAESRYAGRLQDELFRVYAGKRTLFTSSGRLQTWYEAVQQADERPLLGFGFGTEDRVFLDRVYNFEGSYIENSFIGFYMQLGVFGLASVLALLVALALAVRRGLADPRTALLAAVTAAGLALWLVQSYAYSVGNVVTVTFWIAAFGVLAVGRGPVRAATVSREEGAVARV